MSKESINMQKLNYFKSKTQTTTSTISKSLQKFPIEVNISSNSKKPKEKNYEKKFSPISLLDHDFDLTTDLKLGWKPKLSENRGPVPFIFGLFSQEKIIRYASKSGLSLIYKNPRPMNSFDLHQKLKRTGSSYLVRDQNYIIGTIANQVMFNKREPNILNLRRNKSENKTIGPKIRRLTTVNKLPSLIEKKTNDISFNSEFESGNLDLAFLKNETEYDLLLRPDTNTKGHTQWFYFQINSFKKINITINIINMAKPKSIFGRGGLPFCAITETDKKPQQGQWNQLSKNCNLSYKRSKIDYLEELLSDSTHSMKKKKIFMCLSFEISLTPGKNFYLAYSIPYTYSQLTNFLGRFVKPDYQSYLHIISKKEEKHEYQIKEPYQDILKMKLLTKTISLLEVPILYITEYKTEPSDYIECQKRPIVYIVARVHPSESPSSYLCQGVIKFLLDLNSKEAKLLRKLFLFKIIPMLNPDGVIAGNFRTNFSGDDLNRRFNKPSSTFHPTVKYFLANLGFELSRRTEF